MITVYLDMDEVLVDFLRGYCRQIGIQYGELMKHWRRGEWEASHAICALTGRTTPLSPEEFWSPVNDNPAFWMSLEPLPWCDRLWKEVHKFVKPFKGDVHILSSPSYCHSSYTGKVRWLKDKFGRDFTNFCLTPHKEILAKPNTVLIDDRESNCYKFTKHGGHSIVFPRFSNGIGEVADPVDWTMSFLETWSVQFHTTEEKL